MLGVVVLALRCKCPLSAVMYFVFVERRGIFENFFLGCVGRQALLHLTIPLKK